jgi:hypothetical protein
MSGTAGPVAIDLSVPGDVRRGEAVPIKVRIVNRSAESVEVYLRGRTITVDVVVTAEGGQQIWSSIGDDVVPGIIQFRRFAPREAIDTTLTWHQMTSEGTPAPSGDYLVQALLLTDEPEPLRSSAVRLRVTP